jgi:predicted MFS family arabinose efflux permease
MWKKVRTGLMFGVACITSPCCTPIVVPIVLALLAGSPAAVWMGQNLGWVYGGLTLISVVSLVLGLRWMNRRSSTSHSADKPTKTIELNRSTESTR